MNWGDKTKHLMFSFPQIHTFPPFYTRQLHEETWRKQRQLWIEIILAYCAAERIFEIDLQAESLLQSPLFYNPQIDRIGVFPCITFNFFLF